MIAAPPLVHELAERGPFAEFRLEGTVWAMDEGAELLRHYVDLLREKSPEANDALVELHRAVGEAGIARHTPSDAPIACAKGCSHCCHQYVSINAVETFQIARQIRSLPDPRSIIAKLEAKLANTSWDPSRDYDVRNPCAFLGPHGACGIHAFRPMICRIIVSMNVSDCIRNLAVGSGDIVLPRAAVSMRGWLRPLLSAAMQAANYPTRDYELCGAIHAVLLDPTIEKRWYNGEDALLPHSRDEEEAGPDLLAEIAGWREMAGV